MPSREKSIAGLGLLVAFAAGLTIGGLRTPASVVTGTVLLAGALAAWAVVVARGRRRAARLAAALADARRRAQVLSDVGADLLAAGNPAGMHRVTVGAAEELLRDCPGGWASMLSIGPEDDFLVTTAGGAVRLPADAVPNDLLARLAGGSMVTAASPADLGLLDLGLLDLGPAGVDAVAPPGFDAAGVAAVVPPGLGAGGLGLAGLGFGRSITLLPLVRGGRFFGVLATGADQPLPPGVTTALEAVRTQVYLALEGGRSPPSSRCGRPWTRSPGSATVACCATGSRGRWPGPAAAAARSACCCSTCRASARSTRCTATTWATNCCGWSPSD